MPAIIVGDKFWAAAPAVKTPPDDEASASCVKVLDHRLGGNRPYDSMPKKKVGLTASDAMFLSTNR